MQAHGGVVGEALYQAAHRSVQSVGVDLIIVVLLFVGITLLTGASPAGVMRSGAGRLTAWMKTSLGRIQTAAHARRSIAGGDGVTGGVGEGFPRLLLRLPPPAMDRPRSTLRTRRPRS